MKRAHQARPTTFEGQNFRSRLEARWACFFDLIGWQWTYEPFDINSVYIPDFLIHGPAPFLVEIKPAATWDGLVPVAEDLIRRGVGDWLLDDYHRKDMDLIVVGASPVLPPHAEQPFREPPLLGLSLRSWSAEFDYASWDTLRPPSWFEEYGNFMHRPSGIGGGDHHLRHDASRAELETLWRTAGNRTQWQPAA